MSLSFTKQIRTLPNGKVSIDMFGFNKSVSRNIEDSSQTSWVVQNMEAKLILQRIEAIVLARSIAYKAAGLRNPLKLNAIRDLDFYISQIKHKPATNIYRFIVAQEAKLNLILPVNKNVYNSNMETIINHAKTKLKILAQ